MVTSRVAVLGAGVAGLSSALLLARDGHPVTVVERDRLELGDAEAATGWRRRGIPHFLQPHAFIPRGRKELIGHLPDVYEALLAAGAHDVDLRRKIPGVVAAVDEDLQYLAVRRPLVEWALRQAVLSQDGIDVRDETQVEGLRIDGGHIEAVGLSNGRLPAELVVDCLGRRSPTSRWLPPGAGSAEGCLSDCGVIYYSRYYRRRPGFRLPDGPWFLSPRGDLGYMGFASFPGDNGTFAAVLAVPTGVPEWRAFREASVFEQAVSRIPMLRSWVDPDGVDPITDVLAMAGLHNTIRTAPSSVIGLVAAGDAYSHTDPVLAHGLAFALVHAAALTDAVSSHEELIDVGAAYENKISGWARERYDLATELDDQRLRRWRGEPVDYTDPDTNYALFSLMAAGAAATVDPDIFRLFNRRIGLLDSTAVLDNDQLAQRRIHELVQQVTAKPLPPQGPTHAEMLSIVGNRLN